MLSDATMPAYFKIYGRGRWASEKENQSREKLGVQKKKTRGTELKVLESI